MSVSGKNVNKQFLKQMLPEIKHIILTNMTVKVYSWPFTFRKVVRQQIWGEVAVLIPASSVDPFWI